MTDAINEETVDPQEFEGRRLAILSSAEEALHSLEHAVNLSTNGILWDMVDKEEISSVIDQVRDQLNTLSETITA